MKKILYFGFDFFSFVLSDLQKRNDVQIVAVFTKESDYSKEIRRLATKGNIPVYFCPLNIEIHQELLSNIDIIISASYDNLIPTNTDVDYQVNLHPSILPVARGSNPIPWVLLDYPKNAGVTLHIMTDKFDAGAVISVGHINNAEKLTFYEYAIKCNITASELMNVFLDNPGESYITAQPQELTKTSFCGQYPDKKRVITQSLSGEEILLLIEKLGPTGVIIILNEIVYKLKGAEFMSVPDIKKFPEYEINAFYLIFRCSNGVILCKPQDYSLN